MSKFAILEHLKASSEASKNFVAGLIGEVVGTVAEALEEMKRAKADKASAIAITIPVSGWGSDNNAGYPKYYDIVVEGLTASDRAEITIAVDSMGTAKACGLCPTNETQEGRIRIRAASVPETEIAAECWIEDGKE